MEENGQKKVASYLLIKTICASVLGLTTFGGAAFVGAVQFENPLWAVPVALLAGFISFVSVDMLLGAVMNDLMDPKTKSIAKWIVMIALLLGTGFSTAIVGFFAGDYLGAPKTTDERQAVRSVVIDQHNERVNVIEQNVLTLKKDLRSITYQFKKDTAAIIAQMPENHRNLYRKGLHARYMSRSGYSTLKENVSRIDSRIAQYENELNSKQSAISEAENGLSSLIASDPLENINQELNAEDAKNKRLGDTVKGLAWVFDAMAVFSLFFSFWFARQSIKSDPSIIPPSNDLHAWVLDRLKNLSKKLFGTTDAADKGFQYLANNFFGMIGDVTSLFGFIFWAVGRIASLPKRLSEKYGFTTFEVVTNDSSPAPSSTPRIIGFHRSSEGSEQRPVNSGELTQKLAGESPVKSSEGKSVNPGATEVSAGEQRPVHQRSEKPVNAPGEHSVNKSSEQVVVNNIVTGEPTFHHYLKNGELREYTRTEVSRWESKYRKEAEKIKDWLKKNQNNAEPKKVLAKKEQLKNKIRQHEYWLGGLNAIDRIKAKK